MERVEIEGISPGELFRLKIEQPAAGAFYGVQGVESNGGQLIGNTKVPFFEFDCILERKGYLGQGNAMQVSAAAFKPDRAFFERQVKKGHQGRVEGNRIP